MEKQTKPAEAQARSGLASSADFTRQQLKHLDREISLMYVSSLCDEDKIQKMIIVPFFECSNMEEYEQFIASLTGTEIPEKGASYADDLLRGELYLDTGGRQFLIGMAKNHNAQTREATVEATLQGPQNAFSENIQTNLNLIRNGYPSVNMIVERMTVGKLSKTPVAVVYDDALADSSALEEVRSKLNTIQAHIVSAAVQLQKLLSDRKFPLIPIMMTTERPDRAVLNLSQGKILLFLEGSPFCLIVPAVFYDFMSAVDDEYQLFWVSRSIKLLRYVALLVALLAPAFYVATISYNPEFYRVQLTLSIAGSRAAVPYPSYIEVLFMMFIADALTEASIRLPKYIGSTATTVGGLILGQAAQQAGLVSSIMIIITAAVAISNFVIPITTMNLAIRFAKYPLILCASLMGLIGLVLGLLGLIIFLTDHRSFGQPFLRLYYSERENGENKRSPS